MPGPDYEKASALGVKMDPFLTFLIDGLLRVLFG